MSIQGPGSMTATSESNGHGSKTADKHSNIPTMGKGINLGLTRILKLLDKLGNPQNSVPIIHVAGTNGKGSVCAYIDSILRESGLRVGRFTSPHLVHVRDSITLHGRAISELDFKTAQKAVQAANTKHEVDASPFELLAATAFQSFKNEDPPLDLAVVEVGMGGSTDATNVCKDPLVTVITAIDMDHQAFLGNTISEIAKVKAGIIKHGHPCILAPQAHFEAVEAVSEVAKIVQAPLVKVEAKPFISQTVQLTFKNTSIEAQLPLLGSYQAGNAATAVATIETLCSSTAFDKSQCITPDSLKRGIERTRWPGRLDWLQVQDKKLLLDGAHNPASIRELASFLGTLPPANTTFILALSSPRDPWTLLKPLLAATSIEEVQVIATQFTQPDGMPWVTPVKASDIAQAASRACVKARHTSSVKEALELVERNNNNRIVICGSLYLVADVYRLLEELDCK